MIGHRTLRWDRFYNALGNTMAASSRVTAKHLLAWDHNQALDLSLLLRSLWHLDCKLAHDRIFGIYPVLIRAGLDLPKPDYGRPVSHVFQEVVVAFVHVTESLAPLWMTLPAASTEGLPSWVPNWLTYCPEIRHREGFLDAVETSGTFERHGCRGNATPLSRAQVAHFDIARGTLKLKGKHLSKIKQRLSCLPQDPRYGDGLAQDEEFVDICRQWCRSVHCSMGESVMGAVEWLINCVALLTYCKPSELEGWFHWMLHADVEQAALIAASKATRPGYFQHLYGARPPRARLSPSSTISEITEYLEISCIDTQRYVTQGVHYAFITLESGHFGRAHYSCQEGDSVYLLAGCEMPLILRPHGDAFRVVAPAHVLGAMEGELWSDDESALETITLV